MIYTDDWSKISTDINLLNDLEQKAIPDYLKRCRWFSAKSTQLDSVNIDQVFTINIENYAAHLIILTVYYGTNNSDRFLLPVTLAKDEHITSKSFISEISIHNKKLNIVDAIYCPLFLEQLFNCIAENKTIHFKDQRIEFRSGKGLLPNARYTFSKTLELDQSNSSFIVNDAYFCKLFRKLFTTDNPDFEMVSFLTEETEFKNLPTFAGVIAMYDKEVPTTLALMQSKVVYEKDCWSLCGDYLNDYLFSVQRGERIISEQTNALVRLLAKRTADLHNALASGTRKEFIPEPFNSAYREQHLLKLKLLTEQRYELLDDNLYKLNDYGLQLAHHFKNKKDQILSYFNTLSSKFLDGIRIRIHGDYHLGQILFTGDDVIIIDYEGEPESSIQERRIKHSPLKDVAGILRSFHYAVCAKLFFSVETKNLAADEVSAAATYWYEQVKALFLENYFLQTDSIYNKQENQESIDFLLNLHLLEKAIYELGYELNSRPGWIKIPLKGIEHTLQLIQTNNTSNNH